MRTVRRTPSNVQRRGSDVRTVPFHGPRTTMPCFYKAQWLESPRGKVALQSAPYRCFAEYNTPRKGYQGADSSKYGMRKLNRVRYRWMDQRSYHQVCTDSDEKKNQSTVTKGPDRITIISIKCCTCPSADLADFLRTALLYEHHSNKATTSVIRRMEPSSSRETQAQ